MNPLGKNSMKNMSFGEQGIPISDGSNAVIGNHGYSQTMPSQKLYQYSNLEEPNQQIYQQQQQQQYQQQQHQQYNQELYQKKQLQENEHIPQQYRNMRQIQNPNMQQQQQPQLMNKIVDINNPLEQLPQQQQQQYYSVLSNSYLSSQQQLEEQQLNELKDIQQRANQQLKHSQHQLSQEQQQQQQGDFVNNHQIQSNVERKIHEQQQQARQNLLLQQRIQDQQGELHEVDEEEDEDHHYNSRSLQNQDKSKLQYLQEQQTRNQQQLDLQERQSGNQNEDEDEDEEDDGENENEQEEDDDEQDVPKREYIDGNQEIERVNQEIKDNRIHQQQPQQQNEDEDDEEQGEDEGNDEDEQENNDEEDDQGDNQGQEEIYECTKCGNPAEEALMMECKHILCINCASIQYRLMLKKSQAQQNQDLLQIIECEICGVSTPLPEDSIKVLLSANISFPEYRVAYQNQQQQQIGQNLPQQVSMYQQSIDQAGNSIDFYQQNGQFSQSQIHQQSLQSNPQQLQQYYNTFQQTSNNINSGQSSQYQSRQGNFQHQQIPSFSNKQNFHEGANNAQNAHPSNIENKFQHDNQFVENIKASKQRKISREGQNKGSQNQSQNQSLIDKNSDDPILYCFTCESTCFTLEDYLQGLHKNHNVKNVTKAYSQLQEPIDDLRFKIKTRADLLIQDDLRLNKKKKELGDALEQCKNQIKQSFEEVFQALQQKHQELIQQAEESIEEKLDDIDKGLNKVNQNLSILGEFDKNLDDLYYKSERVVQNEIKAFNHYSENKTKILETIQQMDTNLFHTIRDKAQFEFQLDTNSLYSHIDSIKRVKVEIFRLKGLDNPDPNRIEQKFNQNQLQEKSKKLLEQIIQQHASTANATAAAARVQTSCLEEDISSSSHVLANHAQSPNTIPSQQHHLINSQSLVNSSNIFVSNNNNNNINNPPPSYYLTSNAQNNNNTNVADIFNNHKTLSTITGSQNQNVETQLSPGRYIKIRMNGTAETSKRYQSPTTNGSSSNTSRKIKLSPSGRDLNVQKQLHLSSGNLNGGVSTSFRQFSINAQSTKQAFVNMLQSPSSIVKKYTPQYEKLSLKQTKNELFLKQNQSLNYGSNNNNSNVNNSKVNIIEQLEFYRRNIEEIRKQGQADENNLNNNNHASKLPTPEEQASIAASNRIRLLEDKLATKFC